MKFAAAMVGNSSSGIIEAASFELPVVNVGLRQAGRQRSRNTIDVPCEAKRIADAIERALSPQFRDSLAGTTNVYGDGRASERIVARLRDTRRDEKLYVKRFHDLP
jgi:UDP-N-acetylglucosamine 2-epimerase